jgi:predicted transcriptional regulator of viral defense system
MPGSAYVAIYEIAEEQNGYVTAAQAAAVDVGKGTLAKMARRGVLERVSWGVYRLSRFPSSPLDQYVEASLWPLSARGVVSHESALAVYGLSDVSPAKIHVTVPRSVRVRRRLPAGLVVHRADLGPGEMQVHEGVPVTTPERTIRDCHAAHLGPALVRQAIRDGRRTGHLRVAQAEKLERELLGAHQNGEES